MRVVLGLSRMEFCAVPPIRVDVRRPLTRRRRRFVPDSVLEGDGFEPLVPHKKQPFLAAPVRSRNSPSATKTGCFVPGTDGSNPSPSSGESGANLIPGF